MFWSRDTSEIQRAGLEEKHALKDHCHSLGFKLLWSGLFCWQATIYFSQPCVELPHNPSSSKCFWWSWHDVCSKCWKWFSMTFRYCAISISVIIQAFVIFLVLSALLMDPPACLICLYPLTLLSFSSLSSKCQGMTYCCSNCLIL